MTALAADRNTVARDGVDYSYPVAASVTCYAGALAVLDASGDVKPAVTATGLVPVGIFTEQVSNGVTAAAVNATVRKGTFRLENSSSTDAITKAEIGDVCWLVDDQTVAKTCGDGTRSPAGVVVDVDALGVWVAVNAAGRAPTAIPVALGSLSTKAADAAVLRFVSPVAGVITKIQSVMNAALATGDATLTAAINGTDITTGVLTLTQSGSAAGDVDVCTPTALNTVAVGDVVTLTGGGASTATATANVSLLIVPSA